MTIAINTSSCDVQCCHAAKCCLLPNVVSHLRCLCLRCNQYANKLKQRSRAEHLLVTLLSITHHIQANSSKLLPLVNLCCNQSIVGRPAGVSMVCSVAMLPHVASCQMLLPHACVACGLAESLACVCVRTSAAAGMEFPRPLISRRDV